jgi:hypothetical protein
MQVLKYIKSTRDFRISFSRLKERQKVKGYMDSDYIKDHIDCRLTYKFVFMLLKGLLTWYSRKQRFISTLTIEAKYIALYYRSKEVIWIKELLKELSFI